MKIDIPTEPLGTLCKVVAGGTPSRSQPELYGGSIPWVKISDMLQGVINSTEESITETALLESTAKLLPAGTVLLSIFATIGRTAVLGVPAATNQAIVGITPNDNRITPEFLRRFLDFSAPKLASQGRGVAQNNINSSILRALMVPLLTSDEQKEIVTILDKADSVRRKRQQALLLTEDFLRSVFLEMFGDPSKHGWKMITVTDMLSSKDGAMRTGPFGSQLLHSEFVDEGIAVLGIDNAVSNEFRWGKPRFITEAKYEEMQRYTVRPGDVIITIMGTVGRCAIVPDDIPTAINTKHLCCITLDHEKCLPEFLHAYFLTHPVARKYLASTAKGAIMDGLNMGIIKALPVPQVPLRLQEEYRELVRAHSKMKVRLTDHQAASETLFSSLQQRAFSGQL